MSTVTMQELELEHAGLLPSRETLNNWGGRSGGFSFTNGSYDGNGNGNAGGFLSPSILSGNLNGNLDGTSISVF
jgi:hypothetical protein